MKMHKGFSLLEILIAMIILSISALGLAKLNGVMTKSVMNATERNEAKTIAEGMFESLRQDAREKKTYGLNPISLNGLSLTRQNNLYYKVDDIPGKSSTYDIELRFAASPVSEWGTANKSGALQTQIWVYWTDAIGQQQHVILNGNIAYPKIATTSLPRPNKLCQWSQNHPVYLQGTWIRHGGNGGNKAVFFCYKPNGCAKGAHNTPEAKPEEWKPMGEFAYDNSDIEPPNSTKCSPPNADGSPTA